MRHTDTGELRRLVDDPWGVRETTRLHVRSCERCSHRKQRIETDAVAVSDLLPDLAGSEIGADIAWAALRRRLEGVTAAAGGAITDRGRRLHLSRRAMAVGLGGLAVLGVTAAGAAEVVSVLSPTKVAPVQLGSSDVSALLQALPTATLTQSNAGGTYQVGSLSAAEAATGLELRLPTGLPTGVASTPTFSVEPAVTLELSFGRASRGQTVGRGTVPSWLVGTTLRIQAGPAVLVTYSGASSASPLPALAIGFSKAPVLTATGATPQSIEDFVLSQPGISPALAAEMRVLGAPGAVLPVPIPSGATVANAVVKGSPAVVLSDASGFASGVIWESGDTVRVVGGLVSANEALQVADELG
jgi:hypothetical protein